MTTVKAIYGYCSASGVAFSPRRAAVAMGTSFDKAIEVGDVLNTGRWKGKQKQSDRGYAALNFDLVPKEAPTECRWEMTLEKIRLFLGACRDAGATDMGVVFFVGYVAQCNLELDPTRLRELADLGVSIGLTCYVDSDQIDPHEP
jgi:hypothetical protein